MPRRRKIAPKWWIEPGAYDQIIWLLEGGREFYGGKMLGNFEIEPGMTTYYYTKWFFEWSKNKSSLFFQQLSVDNPL